MASSSPPSSPPRSSSSSSVMPVGSSSSEADWIPSSPTQSPRVSADVGVGVGVVSPSDPSPTPTLSKSARRRQARKLGAWKAEEAKVIQSNLLHTTPTRPAAPPAASRHTPTPPSHAAAVRSTPSLTHRPDATHMDVHHSPFHLHTSSGRHSVLVLLQDMFPGIEVEVLEAIYQSCGTFDRVVEYMLTETAHEAHQERQIQQAIQASTAEFEGLDVSPSLPSRIDRLSTLPLEIFFHCCSYLDPIFDLAVLGSCNREIQGQCDQLISRVDSLDFSRSRFSHWNDWRILRMMSRYPGTEQISLRNTQFRSFDQLHRVCFGRKLRSLSVSGCLGLEDHHLQELFGLGEYLTSLDLSFTDLTDDGLEYLATSRENKSLEKLNLSECKFLSTLGVLRIFERCTNLKHIDLKGTNVTKMLCNFTKRNLLNILNLSTCRKLPSEFSITSRFCQLSELVLSSNLSLKDVQLSIPTLKHLNLSNSKHIKKLELYTPRLEHLNMNGCLALSKIDTIVASSETFLTRLITLNANGCRSITSLSFDRLLKSSRDTLRSLTCRGCILLTDGNLSILLREEEGEEAEAYTAASSSSASSSSSSSSSNVTPSPTSSPMPSPSRFQQLEFLDLSGCKSSSSSVILTLQRQVASHIQALARKGENEQRRSDVGRANNGVMNGIHPRTSDPNAIWSGGLDDEEFDESTNGTSGAVAASPSSEEEEEDTPTSERDLDTPCL